MALETVAGNSLSFIGTATTLIKLGPFTLLTDPNFRQLGQPVIGSVLEYRTARDSPVLRIYLRRHHLPRRSHHHGSAAGHRPRPIAAPRPRHP
jgi:L-ascorbate metabolism protein UlaG (beta-lactamase superfamily)